MQNTKLEKQILVYHENIKLNIVKMKINQSSIENDLKKLN